MSTKANLLVLQDVGYEFSVEDWVHLFRVTGAIAAHGYMMLPYELVCDVVPATNLYKFALIEANGVQQPRLGSLGVAMVTSTGAIAGPPFFAAHFMQSGDIALLVEIVARAGPMLAFKIERVPLPGPGSPQSIVRTIGLPDNMLPVRVLDFGRAVDRNGKLKVKDAVALPYTIVHAEEFYEALEYAHAIDVKSLTFQNVYLFCRRRSRGMKLINRQLVSA